VLADLRPVEGADLLVGHATNDDAAVLRIAGDVAIAQTVDFFTPIVDDPYLFGAIAAANSVSDVYAMGAKPVLGLAIVGFPSDVLPLEVLHEILRGGAEKAAEAGFPIAGGHTIIDDVPKYGLAVTGVVAVDKIVRNSTAQPGDVLVLTKPLGNGILVSAFRARSGKRFGRKPPELDEAIRWMTMLNRDAAQAMVDAGVRTATDITGYGFVGHLLEMACGAEIRMHDVPLLDGAREWLRRGYRPAGTTRNAEAFRTRVDVKVTEEDYLLLCDAQTSGGLLMAVAPDRLDALESRMRQSGLFYAKVGHITGESGKVTLAP